MISRTYTVIEIDWMREMIRNSIRIGVGGPSHSEVAAQAEDQLRTHMANGTTPEELAHVYGPGFGPRVVRYASEDK